ncbi:DNA-directed RNA polymerase subunit H [Vulcanisaeta distributa]|uniref:DNA-directed RNA polymerase subunit Rpo5 n=1 Tax=Vulcanisaeta distributa (strain DSM 14429 / JCM 11212 / NBRC 100878 / IC-017) TaxID=572478 RepID=E1QR98_VULDI|nr:DNA-directed RNA polymerase subunit H [Vulcanisaeta distributa]ADN50595.1 RNA polymerase Rpb5 [Vulcanisaeta distributa DSM 14429]
MSSGGRRRKTEERFRRILEHEYMPKAEIVPKEEVKEILRQLNAKVFQLPWIRASDPLARAIGAKPGNVIRIIRKSDTAGEFVTYRFVVPG